MITDEERREVARRLRAVAKKLGPNMDAHEFAHYTADVLDVGESMTWYEMELRLADLIEPSCDRDAPQKVAEEMFGKMRHSKKEGADAYDAMLKSKSVEIHPVDRDALLELADNLDSSTSMLLKQNDLDHNRKRRDMRRDHAQSLMAASGRIREALGVER